MIIFVNDIPVRILKEGELFDEGRVNTILDVTKEPITQAKLSESCLGAGRCRARD